MSVSIAEPDDAAVVEPTSGDLRSCSPMGISRVRLARMWLTVITGGWLPNEYPAMFLDGDYVLYSLMIIS